MKRSGRTSIPVLQAIVLYERFRSWAKVSEVLRRADGSRFTAMGIWAAVRRHDLRSAA